MESFITRQRTQPLLTTEIFQSLCKFLQQAFPLTTATVNSQKTFCSRKYSKYTRYSNYLWQNFWTAKDSSKLLPSSFNSLFLPRFASLPFYQLSILPCTMYSDRTGSVFGGLDIRCCRWRPLMWTLYLYLIINPVPARPISFLVLSLSFISIDSNKDFTHVRRVACIDIKILLTLVRLLTTLKQEAQTSFLMRTLLAGSANWVTNLKYWYGNLIWRPWSRIHKLRCSGKTFAKKVRSVGGM